MTQVGDIISFNEPRLGIADKDTWLVGSIDEYGAMALKHVKIVQMRCGIRIMLPAKDKSLNFPVTENRSRFRS